MIDMQEIEKEIKALENSEVTNYCVCDKLAILYTIRDHFKGGSVVMESHDEPINRMMASPKGL